MIPPSQSLALGVFLLQAATAIGGEPHLPSADLNGDLSGASKVPIAAPSAPSRFRLGVGFAPLLNVDVGFSGLGGYSNPLVPQPLGGGQDYLYDDGSVSVDASGNAGGLTSFWAYQNNSQYDPSGTGALNFGISSSRGDGTVSNTENYSPGFEVMGDFLIGEVPGIEFAGRKPTWGLRGNLNYTRITTGNSDRTLSDVQVLTDTFTLNGVIPPLAPYAGSFTGPGPLIGDSPSRGQTVLSNAATITGSRELDLDLLGIGLGVFVEQEVSNRFSIGAEIGANLAYANGEYRNRSTTSIPGLGSQGQLASGRDSDWLLGCHAGLLGSLDFSEQWALQGSARYQFYQDLEITAGSSRAELSFDGAFVLSLGVLYNY